MQPQTTKITKRSIRRRNRNKRRRKIRKQQKNAQTADGKTKRETKDPKKLKLPKENMFTQENGKWEALCLETYQKLTSWQCEAELNFWKARAEFLQNENKELKKQLQNQEEIIEEETDEGQHDDEEEEEEVENIIDEDEDDTENYDVDPGYLEFIAITRKHREDLKISRAKNLEEAQSVELV